MVMEEIPKVRCGCTIGGHEQGTDFAAQFLLNGAVTNGGVDRTWYPMCPFVNRRWGCCWQCTVDWLIVKNHGRWRGESRDSIDVFEVRYT